MRMSSKIAAALAVALAAALPGAASAQDYNAQPLRLVVPFGPGSATDQIARGLGQALTELYGIRVIVENKPGAGGSIGAQDVANAAPDGHTVLLSTNSTHAANPHLYANLSYDPVEDFQPVTLLARGAMLMVVNAQSPIESVAQFIEEAKARPGDLSFGEGSSSSRVGAEMFKQLADVDMVHVPYPSNPNAHLDLMGGRIDVVFSDVASTLPHVQGGALRALGFTGAERAPNLPDLPTVAEQGVEGYEVSFWFATYLPAGVAPETVAKLNEMFIAANDQPVMQSIRETGGAEIFTSTPEELAAFQIAESERWGEVIRAAGIEPQ